MKAKVNGVEVEVLEYSNKGIVILLGYMESKYRLLIKFSGNFHKELSCEFTKE